MTAPRKLLVLCCLALLVAVVLRLALTPSPEPNRELDLTSAPLATDSANDGRIAVTPPAPAPAASDYAPARDTAPNSNAGLDAGAVDQFTTDGLREDEDTNRPRTRAHGRLLDEQDKPVADARVLASLRETHAGAALDAPANVGLVRETLSDADGSFLLPELDPGELRLEVRDHRFAPLISRKLQLPPGKQTELGDLHLARGVVLAGRVVDSDQRPLASASISLVSAPLIGPLHRLGAQPASPLCSTDEAGRFESPCVAPGRCTLIVRAETAPETIFEVEVPADVDALTDLEFVLPPAATLAGHVLDFDAGTMQGLLVQATPDDAMEWAAQIPTSDVQRSWIGGVQSAPLDDNGRFCLAALVPGRNYLLVARRAEQSATAREAAVPEPWSPVTRAAAGEQDAEVRYLPGCRIDFEAVDSSTGAGVERLSVRVKGAWPEYPAAGERRASDGTPLAQTFFPGGRVSLLDLRATTLADAPLPGASQALTGLADLSVEAPGYDTVHLEGLRLEAGTRLDLGMLQLRPVAVLVVRVLSEESGAGLAGARVELRADHPERLIGRTRSLTISDARGFARLTSLPSPAATIFVSCEGYAPTLRMAPGQVRATDAPLEILLQPQARVRVQVRDERGQPASAVNVSIERQAMPDRLVWGRSALSDADGRVEFGDLPAGVFNVAAISRGSAAEVAAAISGPLSSSSVVLNSGEERDVSLQIQAFSTLSGTLWLGRDLLPRARISIEPGSRGFRDLGTDMARFQTAARITCDAQGSFGDVQLLPGPYSLLIEQAEYGVRTLRVVQVERFATDVIIDVDDTAITGRVLDARGEPVAGATVRLFVDRPGQRQDLRPVEGEFLVPFEDYRRPIAETVCNASGGYRLGGVPPGIPLQMSFTSGRRAAAIPRINAPQGSTLEGIDAQLPDLGSLEVILSAPLAPHGLHYGVRVVWLDQTEGLGLFGLPFGEDRHAFFDELPPGRWVVLVFTLNAVEQVVERRQAQTVRVKPGKSTEFTVGW